MTRESLQKGILCGGKSAAERSTWREERRGEKVFVERTSPKRGERHGLVSRKWDQSIPDTSHLSRTDGGPKSDLFLYCSERKSGIIRGAY
jgi:hypothetical protein